MTRRAAVIAFLESREGFGWIVILTFATILAVVAGCGFYKVSLDAYVANKNDEKGTALELVDAFVTNYSNLRLQLGADSAPVPATFRAHSIDLFNKTRGAANALRLHWIGRAGRSIATTPADAKSPRRSNRSSGAPIRRRCRNLSRSTASRYSARSILRSRASTAASTVTTNCSPICIGN